MRHHECNETERLATTDPLAPTDQVHLSSCRSCREYLTVASAMSQLEAETHARSPMPSAQAVFIRARLLGRRRLVADSGRPLVAFQRVADAIIAACWLVFLMMQWTPFTQWLGGIEIGITSGIRSAGSLPLNFFWMFAVLSLMTMMTMLHAIWTEEHA